MCIPIIPNEDISNTYQRLLKSIVFVVVDTYCYLHIFKVFTRIMACC